jgi:uncharacterized protein YjbI with pentapeptide repeats
MDDARLPGVTLKGASLVGATLNGARLDRVRSLYSEGFTRESDLEGAQLEGAELRNAVLSGSNLMWARLAHADLTGAHLNGVRFDYAFLRGAVLERVRMVGTSLEWTKMEGAIINAAWLDEIPVYQAKLNNCNLQYTYWSGTEDESQSWQSDISGVQFQGAALRHVSFFESAFGEKNTFHSSFADGTVQLPHGVERPAHWPGQKLDDLRFFGAWRGWIESGPNPRMWQRIAPMGYENVATIPPPPGLEWSKPRRK